MTIPNSLNLVNEDRKNSPAELLEAIKTASKEATPDPWMNWYGSIALAWPRDVYEKYTNAYASFTEYPYRLPREDQAANALLCALLRNNVPLILDALSNTNTTLLKPTYTPNFGSRELNDLGCAFDTLVNLELTKAIKKHGIEPWSRHEFYGILKEEVDELWDDIKANAPSEKLFAELYQIACVCKRFAITPDRYRGEQPTLEMCNAALATHNANQIKESVT